MNKRVSELEGAELDYWVAVAEGDTWEVEIRGGRCLRTIAGEWTPSRCWKLGGPIIERHGCSIQAIPEGGWSVYDDNTEQWYWDDSLLVAAMRAFVASKLGDTVEEIDR